ncbi:hypothetical protein ISCGN_016748 [Ixodes scapularis]
MVFLHFVQPSRMTRSPWRVWSENFSRRKKNAEMPQSMGSDAVDGNLRRPSHECSYKRSFGTEDWLSSIPLTSVDASPSALHGLPPARRRSILGKNKFLR